MNHLSGPSPIDQTPEHATTCISVVNEFPEDLYDAMREFLRAHPQWDQQRLMQASLALFLWQHGGIDRAMSRPHLNGLFRREASQAPAPVRKPTPQIRATAASPAHVNPNQPFPQDRAQPAAA